MLELSKLLPALLASLAILPTTFAIPLVQTEKLDERLVQLHFELASIGDSWAAGQAVERSNAYGGPSEWDSCYKHKASWEALMASDNTWTDDPINFKYAACSGAKLADATSGPKPQIPQIGRPQLLTMEMGGNNVHFGDILWYCVYIGQTGVRGGEYPDPNGDCYKSITQWETYLEAPASAGESNSFYFDHHQQLQAILASDLIKGRTDFWLLVVGYGQFFNVKSPDSDWCNDVSFGLVPAHKPKLTNVLRTKLNDLTAKVNKIMAQSVSDLNNPNYKFYDPSPVFENHRFCEPGHTLNNQYFLKDVWYWGISAPENDPDYATLSATDPKETQWAQNFIFFNGTQATQTELLAMLDPADPSAWSANNPFLDGPTVAGNPYDSWSGRAFHPKDGGHVAMKDGVIKFLRDNKLPGVKPAAPPPPPPKTQPYATGQMHIHINEFWDCLDNSDNLSVEVTMWDALGAQVGYMARTQAGASASAKMGSKLEDLLIITPEWAKGGYIQFQLGSFNFDTNSDRDKTKPTYCIWGGYDPRQGPKCFDDNPYDPQPIRGAYAKNQVDCYYPSPVWHGGKPSDGTSL